MYLVNYTYLEIGITDVLKNAYTIRIHTYLVSASRKIGFASSIRLYLQY